MHKLTGWIALVIGFWAHLCTTSALAEPPKGVTNVRDVEFGSVENPQRFDALRLADIAVGEESNTDTRVLYPTAGLFPEGTKGLAFLFPGTGGKADGDNGLVKSMSGFTNELHLRHGLGVVAAQNPIYSDIPTFSDLEKMISWQLRFMNEIKGQRPEGSTLPLYYFGRSTGAALGMELLHRYLRGDPGYEIVGEFESMTFLSLEGHAEENIKEWLEAERKSPGSDLAVVEAAVHFFRQMRFQTEKLNPAKGKKIPKLVFSFGARDEFGTLSSFLKLIGDLERQHPEVPFEIVIHHGKHEPAKAVPEANIADLECLRMILENSFSPTRATKAGRNIRLVPEPTAVWKGIFQTRGETELNDVLEALQMEMPPGFSPIVTARPVTNHLLEGVAPLKLRVGDFSNSLVIGEITGLNTKVIRSKNELSKAKKLTIIVTGPPKPKDPNSRDFYDPYGPLNAMAPVAADLVKSRGQAVLVFQLSEGTPEKNRAEFLEMIRFALANAPAGIPVNFHGQSLGAEIGLEAYHDFQKGSADYAFLRDFDRMLFAGYDVSEEAVAASQAKWRTEKVASLPTGAKSPRLFFAVGGADDTREPSKSIASAKAFAANHPSADVTLTVHAGRHDPSLPVQKGIGAMTAMKLIYDRLYDEQAARAGGPGFRTVHIPDEAKVEASLESSKFTDQLALCRSVLGEANGT